MSIRFIDKWKMAGRYEDDFETEVGGFDEEDCMYKLCELIEEHGNLTWYSGVTDEEYIDGEYCGSWMFLY